MMGPVEREVVSFVAEQVGVPKHRVRIYTTLVGDLRVHGDDAEDLMVEFARRFKVDLAEFDLGRHFEPEDSGRVAPILVLLRRLVGQTPEEARELEPLTVRDLVAAASAGRWTPRQRPSVEEAVYRVLEDLGVKPADARRHDAQLLDLVLDEDATCGFIPDVQELLGIQVPNEEWERVSTVGEAIAMLREHVVARHGEGG
jgi:acyl carrier protein